MVESSSHYLDFLAFDQKQVADVLSVELIGVSEKTSKRYKLRRDILASAAALLDIDTPKEPSSGAFYQDKITEFDEPFVRSSVEYHVESLRKSAINQGLIWPSRVISASMPAGDINAVCRKDPYDGDVIYVYADAELLVYLNVISKLFSLSLSVSVFDDAFNVNIYSKRVHYDQEYFAKLMSIFSAVIITGRARVSKPWLADDVTSFKASVISHAATRFVIAHELSHYLRGHLDEFDPNLSIQHEFEADELAIDLCHDCIEDKNIGLLQYLAPFIFLKSIYIMDSLKLKSNNAVSLTHPASGERVFALRKKIISKTPNKYMLKVCFLLNHIDNVMEEWLSYLRPSIYDVKEIDFYSKIPRTLLADVGKPKFL